MQFVLAILLRHKISVSKNFNLAKHTLPGKHFSRLFFFFLFLFCFLPQSLREAKVSSTFRNDSRNAVTNFSESVA